jgi:hypothetical protein
MFRPPEWNLKKKTHPKKRMGKNCYEKEKKHHSL